MYVKAIITIIFSLERFQIKAALLLNTQLFFLHIMERFRCCSLVFVGVFLIESALSLSSFLHAADNAIYGCAHEIYTREDKKLILTGDAQVKKDQVLIKAEKLEYDEIKDQALTNDPVSIQNDSLSIIGTKATLELKARIGVIESPKYTLLLDKNLTAIGAADKLYFLGQGKYRADNATYSTCSSKNLSWFLRMQSLDIDTNKQIASGRKGALYFFDTPILFSPYLSWSLSDERRSGFLVPTTGFNSKSGFEVSVPYYFNFAPNYDLVLRPRFIMRRGAQLNADFRYLQKAYHGSIHLEYMNEDKLLGRNKRWFYKLQHKQSLTPSLNFHINSAKASDTTYSSDLQRNLQDATQQQFMQELSLNYNYNNLQLFIKTQKFQTLVPNQIPFNRIPQINLRYLKKNSNFITQLEADITQFKKNPQSNLLNAQAIDIAGIAVIRSFIKPEISYNYRTASFFLTPKVTIHATNYIFKTPIGGSQIPQLLAPTVLIVTPLFAKSSKNRVIPTISFNTGLLFERITSNVLGKPVKQKILNTLEPRLFYVYSPFREQTQIPLLDTASADFNFMQIFSEQPFIGNDRIVDNNKLSVGVVSRWLEADSKIEVASFNFAQRFDFQGQKVGLSQTNLQSKRNHSDILSGVTVKFLQSVSAQLGAQYSINKKQLQAASLDLSWRPSPGKTINFSYRYQRSSDVLGAVPLRQMIASGQWLVKNNLSAIARINYDAANSKIVDGIAGFEYDAGCWLMRMVFRSLSNINKTSNNNLYLQLEFKGLSKVGMSADDIFKLNVPGYTPAFAQPKN